MASLYAENRSLPYWKRAIHGCRQAIYLSDNNEIENSYTSVKLEKPRLQIRSRGDLCGAGLAASANPAPLQAGHIFI